MDYKEILKGIVNIINTTKNSDIGFLNICTYIGENCLELKESEDERIRKEFCKDIRTFIPNEKANKYIAWLEKQKPVSITDEWIEDYWQHEKVINPCSYDKGEEIQFDHQGFVSFCKKYCKKPVERNKEDEKIRKSLINFLKSPFVNENITDEKVAPWIAWLEKQGKQKPADKVEPEFHEGDWVVNKLGDSWHIDSFDKENYQVSNGKGNYNWFPISKQDEMHLWTIEDAKRGDVLAYATDEGDSWIMIYWSLYEPYEGHVHYHALLVNDNFSDKGTCCICIDNLKPATKEQRDLLFQKMKQEGYEWDSDKKELKKIESKMLDADKVIEWLKAKVYDDSTYGMAMIDKFKKDFGLWNDKMN